MIPKWHKSESRDVRPFFDVEALHELLAGAEIQLWENAPFSIEKSIVVGDDEIRKLKPVVRHNLLPETVRNCPTVEAKNLLLVFSGTSPFLKNSIVIKELHVNDDYPSELIVPAETLDALGGGGDILLDIALCVDSDSPKQPGRPFRRGHWLSRKTFRLSPTKPAPDFSIEPLNDEGFLAFGLPAKTLYYVDYIGFINEPANPDQPIAKVYIHADVYNRLVAESNLKIVKPLMAFLAAEITCQLLASSAKDWDGTQVATPQSPLAAFVKRLGRTRKLGLPELRGMVDEPGTQRLRALLQADQETVRTVVEL